MEREEPPVPPPPSAGLSPSQRRLLWAIVGLGLALRLIHLAALLGTPYPDLPHLFVHSDLHATWEWAEQIRGGDLLGRATYHPSFPWMEQIAPPETWYRWWGGPEVFQQAPLYPYLVALLLALSGGSLVFVYAVQLVTGALQPLILCALGRRLWSPRAGLLAAAGGAVYGPLVFQQATLLRDVLPPLLAPLALLLVLRARETGGAGRWMAAGAASGAAILAKPTFLLVVPLLGLWLVLEHRPAPRRALRPAAWLALGLGLALAPLVGRNAAVGAPLLAISNRAAEGFVQANAADGYPVGLTQPPSMGPILRHSGGRLPAVVVATLRTHEGPAAFVAHKAISVRGLLDPLEVPNNASYAYAREVSPVLRLTLGWGLLLPLAAAGLVVVGRGSCGRRLLAWFTLATVLWLLAYPLIGRYRLELVPPALLYAGAALDRAAQALAARDRRRGAALLGLVVGAALVQHLLAPLPALREQALYVQEYFVVAGGWAARGEPLAAAEEMRRLADRVEGRPQFAPMLARAVEAEVDYRLAAGDAPGARAAGARHPDPDERHLLEALTLRAEGRRPEAAAALERYLATDPPAGRAGRARALLEELEEDPSGRRSAG